MPIAKLPNRQARIAAYALAGLYGLACLVIGASWFFVGKGTLVAGFPSTLAEAVACAGGGTAVIAWAVARLRRELQAPR